MALNRCACGIADVDCNYHKPTPRMTPIMIDGGDGLNIPPAGRLIDALAWFVYSLVRFPGETDEQLTARCLLAEIK